jgi:hypothetical protein
MKQLILIAFFSLISVYSNAQYFNNVNSELCYELYRKTDRLSEFRVYIVMDEETITENDKRIIGGLDSLSQRQKSIIAQRWAVEGKRIEVERSPYISYQPVFPNHNYFVPQPVPNNKPNWNQWQEGKKYWQYEDRPF